MQADTSTQITYNERLRVAWLLIWRGLAINTLFGFVIGFIVGFVFAFIGLSDWTLSFSMIGGFIVGVFVGSPLIVRMMLNKQFSGFRLQIVRPGPHAPGDDHAS